MRLLTSTSSATSVFKRVGGRLLKVLFRRGLLLLLLAAYLFFNLYRQSSARISFTPLENDSQGLRPYSSHRSNSSEGPLFQAGIHGKDASTYLKCLTSGCIAENIVLARSGYQAYLASTPKEEGLMLQGNAVAVKVKLSGNNFVEGRDYLEIITEKVIMVHVNAREKDTLELLLLALSTIDMARRMGNTDPSLYDVYTVGMSRDMMYQFRQVMKALHFKSVKVMEDTQPTLLHDALIIVDQEINILNIEREVIRTLIAELREPFESSSVPNSICIEMSSISNVDLLKRDVSHDIIVIDTRLELGSLKKELSRCRVLVTSVPLPHLMLLLPAHSTIIQNQGESLHKAQLAQQYRNSYNDIQLRYLYSTSDSTVANRIQLALNFDKTQYLLHMPWEQVNNQLIEFKSACAVASLLERTLVLPMIGYRKDQNAGWDFTFDILSFEWIPMENYFDINVLSGLPCQTITMDDFQSLHYDSSLVNLGRMRFNPVAKATSEKQLIDYFGNVLGMEWDTIVNIERQYQLGSTEVLDLFSKSREKYLALGAMFWFYSFEKYQPYPLKEYVDYMDVSLYRDIVAHLNFVPSIVETTTRAAQILNGGRFIAIHVRRGDYWNKCSKIRDKQLREHCYPSSEQIKAKVKQAVEKSLVLSKESRPMLYIATNLNDPSAQQEFKDLESEYQIRYFENVFERQMDKDSIWQAFLDIELCSQAEVFIGNFYSSFSRTIFEKRKLKSKIYWSF